MMLKKTIKRIAYTVSDTIRSQITGIFDILKVRIHGENFWAMLPCNYSLTLSR